MTLTIGFDPGNSASTVILMSDSGNHMSLTIPSYVGSGTLAELKRLRGGIGEDKLGTNEYILEYSGRPHYIGQLALEYSADADSKRGDVSRYWTGHSLRLLLSIVGTIVDADHFPIRVVTGLPVSIWSKKTVEQAQRSLLGEHCFVLNGRKRQVDVLDVAVIMEGAGALIVHGKTNDVPQAVVDVGGRTTDLFWARGMKPAPERCAGLPVGVEKVADLLVQTIADQHGRYLSPDETQKILRAFSAKAKLPIVYADGIPIKFDDQVKALIDSVASEITSFVSRRWRSEDRGNVAAEAAQVLLIGGGAYYFAGHMQEIIAHLHVPDEPELANAQGYLVFGQRMSEDGWARIRPK